MSDKPPYAQAAEERAWAFNGFAATLNMLHKSAEYQRVVNAIRKVTDWTLEDVLLAIEDEARHIPDPSDYLTAAERVYRRAARGEDGEDTEKAQAIRDEHTYVHVTVPVEAAQRLQLGRCTVPTDYARDGEGEIEVFDIVQIARIGLTDRARVTMRLPLTWAFLGADRWYES